MIIQKKVTAEQNGLRLDDAVAALCGVSKSEARRIIDRGGCAVNAAMVRVASRPVKSGDVIDLGVMEAGRFRDLELPPEALLFEDGELIAVNKPAGINSQRTPYQFKGTLEYWVCEYFRRHGINEPARVVHRLDRGTSGVMIFPKYKPTAAWISDRFKESQVEKRYLALVAGRPPQEAWSCAEPIGKLGPGRYGVVEGGKSALTEFRLLQSSGDFSLIEARPVTGRTHQIRVHLTAAGLPIVGDTTYGGQPEERMFLHCASMALRNKQGRELSFSAPLDEGFERYMGRMQPV